MNDEPLNLDYVLQDGDEITLSPKSPKNRAYRGKLGPADDACLMVSAESAARMFDVSVRQWHRWNSAREIPASVVVGVGNVRWDVAELTAWHQAGRPTRAKWEEEKKRTGA